MLEKHTSESGDRVHKDVQIIGLPEATAGDKAVQEMSEDKSNALSEISEEAAGTGNSTPSMLRFDPDDLEAEISAIKNTGLVEAAAPKGQPPKKAD